MGVAMMLAVLEDTELKHGPIGGAFHRERRSRLGGAHGLQPGLLQGRLMLNLDTEGVGEFYLGCAGGVDVNVERPGQAPSPACRVTCHSRSACKACAAGTPGVNIHEGRGNAIKWLVRVLDLTERFDLRLSSLQAAPARNALPREAFATVAVPSQHQASLAAAIEQWQAPIGSEWSDIEPKLALRVAAAEGLTQLVSASEQAIWLNSLHAAPHGVQRMSVKVPGVVETSNNLGWLIFNPRGSCNFMVRSLIESGFNALADQIISLFKLTGTSATASGHYPGWAPQPCPRLCWRSAGRVPPIAWTTMHIQVIHAGLECGLIAAKYLAWTSCLWPHHSGRARTGRIGRKSQR